MSVVKTLLLPVLFISLFVFLSFEIVYASDCSVDVYNVDTSPTTVKEGENVKISGYVKLVEAPCSQIVSVEWYVDDNLKHTEDYSMEEGNINSVEWNFDTNGLSEGSHSVKIKAIVKSISDEETDHFYVEKNIQISIGSLDVDPSSVCIDEDETVELSIPVTLENGPDNTEVTVKFYIEENDNWYFIDKVERNLDEHETRTFSVDYDYYSDRLDEGSHEVKVVVEAGEQRETDYSYLRVKECYPRVQYDIEVGYINLNPQYPQFGDTVQASVPVSLQSAPSLPQDVNVKVYIDGKYAGSSTLWYYHLDTKTYTFTIDTTEYDSGSHTIDVKATVDGTTDTTRRSFTIERGEVQTGSHCISITNVYADDLLKAGEKTTVHVEVSNCGSLTEYGVKVNLNAFSKTYFGNIYNILLGTTREVQFSVDVPGDVRGITTFGVYAYDSYTSDSTTKDFTIYTGTPLIQIKPEYQVKDCQINEFTFQIMNTGEVADTFSLSVEGQASEWMSGIPNTITLKSNERKDLIAYANIPCDMNEGNYQFTITAKNSQEYSVTSNLNVKKGWTWPTLPTGFIGLTGTWFWLPWILLLILIIVLYIIYLEYVKERKRPMF